MPELAHYGGREQAFVKHTFLDAYLDGLLYKVGSIHDEIAYVDGFAGPWQSASEKFTDTSFGLALNKLRQVKADFARRGRHLSVKAILVEADDDAFARLQTVAPKFPDLTVVAIHGDFNRSISRINSEIGRAFSFIFVDPKGWSVDMAELGHLVSRQNCEVVFNFMFDFVNRFANWEPVRTSMERLFVGVDWQTRIESSANRKSAIHDCFRESLQRVGRYRYCLSTEVLKTDSDRVLYSLFYASRHPKGVEVFRDTQMRAIKTQGMVRAALRQSRAQEATHQVEMFTLNEMSIDETAAIIRAESSRAREMLLSFAPEAPDSMRFGDLATEVMLDCVIRRTEIGRLAASLRKNGLLSFDPWPAKKIVPDDDYRVSASPAPPPS